MSQPATATHESDYHLYYHPDGADRWDGLAPYWALIDLLVNHFDGYREISVDIDGEPAILSLAYSKSGFAPRPDDPIDAERLFELEVHLDLAGERKLHCNVSPRFDDMRHYESGEPVSLAFDHLDADAGVTIQFQGSNVDLDAGPQLFARAVMELAADADYDLHHRYFDRPQGGRIAEVERYVRVTRDWNRKLVQQGGLFDRLAMLLSDEDGTKGEHTWDNTEEFGYHHQVRLDSVGAGKLIPNHRYGRQLKSYLPEDPEAFDEDDPLYNPKFGVLFRQSLHGQAVAWGDRRDLLCELDETIVNCLAWADIPLDVGDDEHCESDGGSNGVFVADDHFDVRPREDDLPIHEDPTPRLEAEQDHLLMTVLRDAGGSAAEIAEAVATDGGQHVEDLADETGYSLSTIYRALQQLDGVIESRDGHVQFVTQKIAEEIRGIVQSAEYAIENAADRAAALFDLDVVQSANSAVSRWLAEYGATFEAPDDLDGRPRIRIDTIMSELKSRSEPHLPTVLDYLVKAWLTDGRKRVDIHDAIVEVDLAEGGSYEAPLRTLR